MSYRYEKKPVPVRVYEETTGQTETFWTRHVKLITFLIVIAVFLALFGPYNVFDLAKSINEKREMEGRITMEEVIALSDLHGSVYLSQLTKYSGELSNLQQLSMYSMDIDERYMLIATAEKNGGRVLYLYLNDRDTGRTVDILTGDVRAFLNQK